MKSKAVFHKNRLKSKVLTVASHTVMICVSIFMIFPLIWVFLTSIKPDDLIYKYPPVFFTELFTLSQYSYAFNSQNLWMFAMNSLIYSFGAGILGVLIGLFAAYALSRYDFAGKGFIFAFIITPMLIPGITNLIPLYSVYTKLGLIDTYIGLILIYIPGILSLSTIVLKNYFDGIPVALEEAAMIDGCSKASLVWRIIIPIVRSGILAVFIINFVTIWNEFIITLIFTSKSEMKTLTLAIFNLIGSTRVRQGPLNATALFTVIPVLAVFLVFRKRFIQTMLDGAIKG